MNIGNVKINKREFLVARSWLFCKRFLEVSVHAIVRPIRPKWNKLHAVVSKKNSTQAVNGVLLYHIYCHMIGPRRNKLQKFHEDIRLHTIRRLTLIRLLLASESFSSFHCSQEQSVHKNLSSSYWVSFQALHTQPINK